MKTHIYYNSPVGILKIGCKADNLVEISFAKEIGKDSSAPSQTALTCKAQLEKYFAGELYEFDLPIAFEKGTPFQQSAWKALLSVPYGQTRCYADMAQLVGKPKAVRAIGGANNKNPIAIVIPCHRIIGKNGKLVGYASGVDKKEWLLQHERENR